MLADDLKVKIKELKTKFDGIEAASDIPALTAKYEQLRKEQEDPELYSDLKRAERINREAKNAGDKLEAVTKMKTDLTDLEGLLDMAAEEKAASRPPSWCRSWKSWKSRSNVCIYRRCSKANTIPAMPY